MFKDVVITYHQRDHLELISAPKCKSICKEFHPFLKVEAEEKESMR